MIVALALAWGLIRRRPAPPAPVAPRLVHLSFSPVGEPILTELA